MYPLSPVKYRRKVLHTVCATGLLFQFGGCELGQITTTTTLDARELIISVVRGTILSPIDQFVTDAVNGLFDGENA